jgi:hypothetical protein
MISAWPVLLSGVTLVVGILVLRAGSSRQIQANPVVYSLTFPSDLEVEAVGRFLASLSGLLPPWWKRWVTQPVVTLEVVADSRGIRHHVVAPVSVSKTVEAGLGAHLPSVRFERTTSPLPKSVVGAEYQISSFRRPLRIDPEAVSSGLLSSLQPLHEGESVVVQWQLTPAGPVRPPRLVQKGQTTNLSLDSQLLDNADAVNALRAKQRAPLLLAVGRIGVVAASNRRQRMLLRQVEAPFHASRAPGVNLRRRLVPAANVAQRIQRRSVPLLHFPMVLNSEEVASLIGWPVGLTRVPGLKLGGCRLLPVPTDVPSKGTVLGLSTFPGTSGRPVALSLRARQVHIAIVGPTGSGKSVLMSHLIEQDLWAGYSVVVLDPKGDLLNTVIETMPEERLRDLIVLDASDDARPVGYNPLKCTTSNRELVVEQVLGVMRSIWKASWGPRSDEIIRACLLTLTAVEGMTLAELPPLLFDEGFRSRLLAKLDDPFGVESFWATYAGWGEAERVANTAPVLNKVRAFTMRSRLRGVLGQSAGAVDFPRIIGSRQVLLVNLAAGRLGTEAAYLLGALLFAGLWDAVSARAGLPAEQRPPVMAHLDEFQHLVALPTPAETVLAEARGYGLGLVLAHQHLGQLSGELERAVRANARSKIIFQTSRQDAVSFSREFGGQLTPEDLMGIPAFEAVVSAFAAGSTQPPATVTTLPPGAPLRAKELVYQGSRQRWGVDRADVDAALAARHQAGRASSGPVGRARRTGS